MGHLLALYYLQRSSKTQYLSMCLSPLTIYSPAKLFAVCGGQPVKITVNCNHCAHCQTRKRDEYSFRTYWHAKETIAKGGYIIFDTLTYSDEYLPHLSHFVDTKKYGIQDFSCFNREHYKLFFKRLRRAIQHKYKLTDAITYFFSTEYGEDDRYTHRPHYHPLIFCKYGHIHPLWLSRKISECWQYGRTDGIVYKPFSYVAKHIYGYNLGLGDNSAEYILRAVTHYVAKYIMKNNKFQTELEKRIRAIVCACDDVDVKSIVSQIQTFHRQSQGYGIAYLNNLTEREINALKRDKGVIPDSYKVEKEIPLPSYYLRKLYYELKTDSKNKKYWSLTQKGVQHKLERMVSSCTEYVERLNNLLANVSEKQKSHIYRLLDGRSLQDYAIYKVFYYGRIRHYNSVNRIDNVTSKVLEESEQLDTGEWLNSITQSFHYHNKPFTHCYNCYDSSNIYVDNVTYIDDIPYTDPANPYDKWTKKEFFNHFCFNSNSCRAFRDYDVLTDYINQLTMLMNVDQQPTFDFKQEYINRIKHYYNVKEN